MLGYLSELYYSYMNKKEEFYYLSLIKEGDGSFSIHGLWPQSSLNSYPSFCRAVNFNLDKLEPIMDELNNYWFSNKGSNDTFWKHEYEKHGSCMFVSMDEFNYFFKDLYGNHYHPNEISAELISIYYLKMMNISHHNYKNIAYSNMLLWLKKLI